MPVSLNLLKKIRCRFLFKDTGLPASGIVASLQVAVGDPPDNLSLIPVGSLCSDSTGYISFDITALIKRGGATAHKLLISSPVVENGVVDLLNLLNISTNETDSNLLHDINFIGADLIDETINAADLGDFYLVFPIYVSNQKSCGQKNTKNRCHSTNLPAIQSPDLSDYSASPYSFVSQASMKLGDGACETLVPSSLPLQEHRFYKVIVRREENEGDLAQIEEIQDVSEVDVINSLASHIPKIKFAEVIEFKQQWFSLGHSLGEIKYSLALAPGEATQVAIIDWSRQDNVSRTDNVVSAEYMDHTLKRDRSIEETIDSALKESQGGSSFMAGTSGQATIPLQYVTLSFNHAIGYGVSNSWGNRNLEADSLQDLHDKIRQQSGYTRSLNSTVVVQASQAEQNVLQTRKVANHNHCHALTIQYYEVLRHFKIRTAFAGRRKAILVPFKPFVFTPDIALRFRSILEITLIDRDLKPCFEAVLRSQTPSIYDNEPASPPSTPAPTPATQYGTKTFDVLTYLEGGNGSNIFVKTDDPIRITATGDAFTGGVELFGPDGHVDIAGNDFTAPNKRKFSLIFKVGTQGSWNQGSSFTEFTADRDGELIFSMNDVRGDYRNNRPIDHSPKNDRWTVTVTYPLHESNTSDPGGSPQPIDPTPSNGNKEIFSRVKDELSLKKLLTHLNGNQGYYNGCIWTLQNPIERRLQMEAALSTYSFLLEAIDEVPLAVSGNYLAFAYDGPFLNWKANRDSDPNKPKEDIVTLPTRGVFAEAMLSHCNACEERDPTRMWDWKEMTIEEPPAISPVTQGPQGQTPNVTPSQLPGNVIQISQPPSAPDPTGLAAALKVLGTPEIFRDMSGLDEVAALLKELSQQSSEANIKALGMQAQERLKQVQEKNKTSAGSGNTSNDGGSGNTRSPASETDSAKQVDRLKAIEYAQSKGLIDDQGAQDATKGLLGGDELASNSNYLPVDYPPRSGVFPTNATTAEKINKILGHFNDVSFSSANEINTLFATLSSKNISGYLQWLEGRRSNLNLVGGNGNFKWTKADGLGHRKAFNFRFSTQAENNFKILWDGIPDVFGATRDSINLIEFLALDLATHVEGYGDYAIVSEAQREGYGLDYFFEPNWVTPSNHIIKKASYNTLATNRTAGDLFRDAQYRSAHDELLPTSNTTWSVTDPLWNGADYFATQAPKSISSSETAFIRQADFYKFRGRGYIQTTGRTNYRFLARILRESLDKLPSPLWSLVESWGPENLTDAELNVALTRSRDNDWNNLFEMTGGIVAHMGVQAFSENNNNCLYIDFSKDALEQTGQGTVAFLGNKINGYGTVLSAAVISILTEMYDSLS